MRPIDQWLLEYGESHQNATNKAIHWICIPLIMFSLFGLLYAIPFPFVAQKTAFLNWGAVFLALALAFYLRLSISMFLGFVLIGAAMLTGNHRIAQTGVSLPLVSILIFVIAWIGQFYGHKIEGKKPSFFKDLQFLLIGPAWLLHFIFKKIGIAY